MFLNPACHIGEPTTCSYQNGILSVRCSVCGKLVGQVLVAKGRENEAPPEWSEPPKPFDTGMCTDCSASLEPQVVQFQVMTPTYEGDLVVVAYQVEGLRKLMINGRVFPWGELDQARDHAIELLGADHADGIMEQALVTLSGCTGIHDPPAGALTH